MPDISAYLHEGMFDVVMGILADERPKKKLVKENTSMTSTTSLDGRPVFLDCGAELPSSRVYVERENHFIVAFVPPRKWKAYSRKSVRKQREAGSDCKQGEVNGEGVCKRQHLAKAISRLCNYCSTIPNYIS